MEPSPTPADVVIGNLDCDSAFAGRGPPSRTALETASALATLLRVFGAPGHRLWTPLPVDPSRVPELPGLPRPQLISGPLAELRVPAGAKVMAWATTSAVSELLTRIGERPPAGVVVSRVNHRGYAHGLADRWGLALPGAGVCTSIAEVRERLRRAGSSPDGRWVLKAPHSSAGRERVFGLGPSLGSVRQAAGALIDRHGAVLFEPWMDRVQDLGITGFVERSDLGLFPIHEVEVDPRGRFRGIRLKVDLSKEDARAIHGAARRVGDALRDEGYTGPFGIDSWRHRARNGAVRLQAIGELNARTTFGHVARAFARHVGSETVALETGRGEPPAGEGILTLLSARSPAGVSAWLSGAP